MIEYSLEYNGYWQRPDRAGTSSFAAPLPIAREVLAVCGPGRLLDIGCGMGALVRTLLDMGVDAHGVDVSSVVVGAANRLAPGRFVSGSALKLPFADRSFETVISTDCLEHLAPHHVAAALTEIHRVCRRHVYLRIATGPDRDNHWHLTIEGRAWWERKAFAAGFRKHPGYYRVNRFEALEHDPYSVTIPLERIDDRALADELFHAAGEADLGGGDMLRQTGRLSDAGLVRYQIAAEHALPEQAVVVLSCGRGYGCAVVLDSSPASRVIGIDASATTIRHARASYTRKGIEFIQHDAFTLPFLDAASVGTVVAFDLPKEPAISDAFLNEVARVLLPGGRFIFSIPGRTGNSQSDAPRLAGPPYRCGLRIKLSFSSALIVERVVAVYAGGQTEGQALERQLVEIGGDAGGTAEQADWWLSVATLVDVAREHGTSPLSTETDADAAELCATARATVRRGATDVVEQRQLTVLLCICLEQGGDTAGGSKAAGPVSGRATSIAYLIGRLHQQAAEMDLARRFYLRAVELGNHTCDAQAAVDQIDAAFRCGLVALGHGDHAAAQDAWNRGVACVQRRLCSAGEALFHLSASDGPPRTSPALLVADGARRCAMGLRLLRIADDKPGFVATRVTDSFEATFAKMEEEASSRESALRERLTQLKGELANTSRNYAETLDSYSWRITAPLRTLADIIRGWTR